MRQNALAVQKKSSEKGDVNGEGDQISSVFWFPVYEGLFEHAPTISDAVWLFMWLIARTTRESNGSGSVLGGAPLHDEYIGKELGFPRKTIRRWRLMLVAGGYISTLRTPYGFRYTLLKSKKWQKQAVTEVPKLPISPEEKSQNGHREVPPRDRRSPKTGISKKTLQRLYRDNRVEAEAAAATTAAIAPLELKTERNPEAWEKAGIPPCGSPRFNAAWEQVWRDRPADEPVSITMERCDQECQANHIPVPMRFFERKKALCRQELPAPLPSAAERREARSESRAEQRARKTREAIARVKAQFKAGKL